MKCIFLSFPILVNSNWLNSDSVVIKKAFSNCILTIFVILRSNYL